MDEHEDNRRIEFTEERSSIRKGHSGRRRGSHICMRPTCLLTASGLLQQRPSTDLGVVGPGPEINLLPMSSAAGEEEESKAILHVRHALALHFLPWIHFPAQQFVTREEKEDERKEGFPSSFSSLSLSHCGRRRPPRHSIAVAFKINRRNAKKTNTNDRARQFNITRN